MFSGQILHSINAIFILPLQQTHLHVPDIKDYLEQTILSRLGNRRFHYSIFKSLQPILGKFYRIYTSKKRIYSYRGIKVVIYPGVFHPRFTFSTKFFVDHLLNLNLEDKRVLELGCGSGLISFHAAAKGASVTATDINPQALHGIEESALINRLAVEALHSDLFENVRPEDFDYIFINPPYYPKKPDSLEEEAWYCGQDFEYFRKLFSQIEHVTATILMILSEDCQIEKIRSISLGAGFDLVKVDEKRIFTELNWIFKITRSSNAKEDKLSSASTH